MSLKGVLSELEGLSLDDDISNDPLTSFLQSFSEKYSVAIGSTKDVFRFVDSLLSGRRIQESKTGAQSAFTSIESLLESQMEETRILATQRNQLVEQLRKLDEVCRESDSQCQHLNTELSQALQKLKEKPATPSTPSTTKIIRKREEDPPNDDAYRLLASVHRSLSNVGGTLEKEVDRIKEDLTKTPGERLITMTKATSDAILSTRKELDRANEKIEQLKKLCDQREKECAQILNVLEEEVDFVQKLAFNKDIQGMVMYRPSGTRGVLDSEQREELARRCATIGAFVDEKVTQLNSYDICDQLTGCGVKKPMEIFELMKPGDSEYRIQQILNDARNSDDLNVRKLTDLVIAQTLMNEILKRHASALADRITDASQCHDRIARLETEKETLVTENSTKNSTVRRLKKKISTMKTELEKVAKATKGEDPVLFIKALQTKLKTARKLATQATNTSLLPPQKVMSTDSSCDDSDFAGVSTPGRVSIEKLNRTQEELEKALLENTQLKQSLELANAKTTVLERQKLTLQAETSRLEKGNTRMQELQEKLQAMSQEMNNTTLKLREDLRLCEQHNAALVDEKTALTNKIEQLEEVYAQGIAEIKSKSGELRTEMNKKVESIDRLTNANQSLTKSLAEKTQEVAKLQADLDALEITNKSLILKLKAAAEKSELERQSLLSQIAATKTSAQSQLHKCEKELTQKVADHDGKIFDQISKIVGHVDDSDIHTALDNLASEVSDLRKVQGIYTSMIEDVSEIQMLLHLNPHERIAEHVKILLTEVEKLKSSADRCREEVARKETDISSAQREVTRLQNSVTAAKQWEAWSRRILRIVRNSRSTELNAEQLRMALEESLLSSVSNRLTLARIETLRSEKKLLTKFNKRLLSAKTEERPHFGSVLVAVITLQRLSRGIGGTSISMSDL